jgi:hypothetical protein
MLIIPAPQCPPAIDLDLSDFLLNTLIQVIRRAGPSPVAEEAPFRWARGFPWRHIQFGDA